MKDKTQDAPPELTLAERRKRLAGALGFLLARAWLREQGQDLQDKPPNLRGPLPPPQSNSPP